MMHGTSQEYKSESYKSSGYGRMEILANLHKWGLIDHPPPASGILNKR